MRTCVRQHLLGMPTQVHKFRYALMAGHRGVHCLARLPEWKLMFNTKYPLYTDFSLRESLLSNRGLWKLFKVTVHMCQSWVSFISQPKDRSSKPTVLTFVFSTLPGVLFKMQLLSLLSSLNTYSLPLFLRQINWSQWDIISLADFYLIRRQCITDTF